MNTVAFDTLAFCQKLEDAGVESTVAKATTNAVAEAQQALVEGPLDDLAKKTDLEAGLNSLEVRLTSRILNYNLALITVFSGIVGGLLALFEWVI